MKPSLQKYPCHNVIAQTADKHRLQEKETRKEKDPKNSEIRIKGARSFMKVKQRVIIQECDENSNQG